jgi:hypothetical protein
VGDDAEYTPLADDPVVGSQMIVAAPFPVTKPFSKRDSLRVKVEEPVDGFLRKRRSVRRDS